MTTKRSLLILFLVSFLIYLPSFGNQFVWDDEQFIYKNEYVKTFNLTGILTQNTVAGAGVVSNYYRPLTTLTFAIDHAIWGLRPFGFHLTNTLLHIGAGLLLYLILRHLKFKAPAFWLALLFLLHPIQTEAVTYINSRGDSLFAFLSFLSIWTMTLALTRTKYQLKLSDGNLNFNRYFWLTISIISFSLSLFAKELAIATLGLHVLIGIWFVYSNKGSLTHKLTTFLPELTSILIMTILSGIYLYLRATVLNFANSFNFYGGETLYTSSLFIRLLTFSKIIWTYLRLLVLPFPLHMERESQIITSFNSPWPWLTLSLIVFLLIAGWWELKQKNTWWVWFGSLWFFGMLAPTSGIIPINGLLYEHWLYLPLVGFGIALVGISQLIPLPPTFQRTHPQLFNSLLICLFSVFALLTLRQNYIWRSPIPFYEYTLQHASSARLHNNLGMSYDDANQPQKAIPEYLAALEISNVYPQVYHNLAGAYIKTNDLEKAEQAYLAALKLEPNFYYSQSSLLQLYLYQKKYGQALLLTEQLIQTYPHDNQLKQLKNQLLKDMKPTP